MEEKKVCKCTVPDSLFSMSEIIFLKTFTCTDGPTVRKFTLRSPSPPMVQ